MLKVVTAREMRDMDQYTIKEIGVPGVVLMENAGTAVFRVIERQLDKIEDPLVYVFCGKGNNGGDGFVVARHLWNEGVYVRVFCCCKESDIEGDARINFNILRKMNIPLEFIDDAAQLEELEHEPPTLLVDALLGTGLSEPAKGLVADVIHFINKDLHTRIVSIDLPSGLNASAAELPGPAIRADLTVTMALPKYCHILYPARGHVGELYITEIGIPPFVLNKEDIKVAVLQEEDIVLPFRYPDSHKYECGKVSVLAGSKGYTGAATLTAKAAMRMGAGMVIAAVPESINPVLEQKLTETITRPIPETAEQTIGEVSLEACRDLIEWGDVLAIGPGLGRTEEVQKTIIQILKECEKPVVIDADALFALANYPELLVEGPHPHWVLTPHMGEFARFFPDVSRESLISNRVAYAQDFAKQYGITLCLKGAPSLVAAPDGRVWLNSTGNAGLASAGTGDVLTGFVAGLLAQSYTVDEAAYTANFVHGYAADYIVSTGTQYTLIAGDLISQLGKALQQLTGNEGTESAH